MNGDVERVLEQARRQRFLLGITGPPGSGKSTCAADLAGQFDALTHHGFAAALPMDGFHLSNTELDRRGLRAIKGNPQTFDATAFLSLLRRLRHETGPVHAPLYSRDLHEPVPDALRIPPQVKVVVVEGNYLLLNTPPWDGVRPLLDEAWYLDVPEDVCLERVKARHLRGGCTEEQAAHKIEANDRVNYRTVESTKTRADRTLR